MHKTEGQLKSLPKTDTKFHELYSKSRSFPTCAPYKIKTESQICLLTSIYTSHGFKCVPSN